MDKQVQIMPHNDLVPKTSALRVKTDGGMSVKRSGGVWGVEVEPNERYSRAKKIIVPVLSTTPCVFMLTSNLQEVHRIPIADVSGDRNFPTG